MSGNDGKPRFVLQKRDMTLLEELYEMRVVDREHAKVIAGFSSTTRANARLLALTRAGYLSRTAVGTRSGGHKYLYSLTRQGAACINRPHRSVPLNSHSIVAGQPFLEHQLRLNALYLRLKFLPNPHAGILLHRWLTFQQPISPQVALIPDAYLELATHNGVRPMFVEVDQGTEPLRVWRRKIEQYLQLATTGAFTQRFQHPQFRVLVSAPSMRRLTSLRSLIAKRTAKIFWLNTHEVADSSRFWEATWHRPTGNQPHTLI